MKHVLEDILTVLRRCGNYRICVQDIDPCKLGVDVRRPRVFILMILGDVVIGGMSENRLRKLVDRTQDDVEAFFSGPLIRKRKWEDLLFSESETVVKKWRQVGESQTRPPLLHTRNANLYPVNFVPIFSTSIFHVVRVPLFNICCFVGPPSRTEGQQ